MSKILSYKRVGEHVDGIFGMSIHAKRRVSVTNALYGIVMGARLSISDIGRVLATRMGKVPKHAIKQVDRLIGNHLLRSEWAAECFARWLCAGRRSLVVSLDWTVYDRDGHHTLALNLVTRHGRATPLLWKSYPADKLKGRQSAYQRTMLRRFKRVVGSDCSVTVLADRGFADTKLFGLIHKGLGWDYVIRLRRATLMRCREEQYSYPIGIIRLHRDKPRCFKSVHLTGTRVPCPAVVMVKASTSKEPWYLATSLNTTPHTVTALYARRFTCEEQFRDVKDPRFGVGLEQSKVGCCDRRDRLLLIQAMATVLLTVLGAAGERLGYDRKLRANTEKKRTHSLFRQGRQYAKGVVNSYSEPIRAAFESIMRQLLGAIDTFGVC